MLLGRGRWKFLHPRTTWFILNRFQSSSEVPSSQTLSFPQRWDKLLFVSSGWGHCVSQPQLLSLFEIIQQPCEFSFQQTGEKRGIQPFLCELLRCRVKIAAHICGGCSSWCSAKCLGECNWMLLWVTDRARQSQCIQMGFQFLTGAAWDKSPVSLFPPNGKRDVHFKRVCDEQLWSELQSISSAFGPPPNSRDPPRVLCRSTWSEWRPLSSCGAGHSVWTQQTHKHTNLCLPLCTRTSSRQKPKTCEKNQNKHLFNS